MKKFVVLAGLLAVVSSANAIGLRLFLSTTGANGPGLASGNPATGVDPVVPNAAGNERFYVWAQILGTEAQIWNGISMHADTSGGASLMGSSFWNHVNTIGQKRWTGITVVNGANTVEARMASALDRGVQNDFIATTFDIQYAAASQSTQLGYIDTDGAGAVNLRVGSLGISRSGGDANGEEIRLGWVGGALNGKADKNNGDGAAGENEGTITPEPASLLLLGLGALALRRR